MRPNLAGYSASTTAITSFTYDLRIKARAYDKFCSGANSRVYLFCCKYGTCSHKHFRELLCHETDRLFCCFCAECHLCTWKATLNQSLRQRYCIFCIFQHYNRNHTKFLKFFCYLFHLNFPSFLSFYIKIHFHYMSDQGNVICNISVSMDRMFYCTCSNTEVYCILRCVIIHQCVDDSAYKCISPSHSVQNVESQTSAFIDFSIFP